MSGRIIQASVSAGRPRPALPSLPSYSFTPGLAVGLSGLARSYLRFYMFITVTLFVFSCHINKCIQIQSQKCSLTQTLTRRDSIHNIIINCFLFNSPSFVTPTQLCFTPCHCFTASVFSSLARDLFDVKHVQSFTSCTPPLSLSPHDLPDGTCIMGRVVVEAAAGSTPVHIPLPRPRMDVQV